MSNDERHNILARSKDEEFTLSETSPTHQKDENTNSPAKTSLPSCSSSATSFSTSLLATLNQVWSRLKSVKIFPKNEVDVCVCGLSESGKTSILYKLKVGETVETIPTIRYNVEHIVHEDVRFMFWDFDNSEFWIRFRHSLKNARAILFVVDSTERAKFDEARNLLSLIVAHRELEPDTVFVILAHKQDLPDACDPDRLRRHLGVKKLLKGRRWTFMSTTIKSGGKEKYYNVKNDLNEILQWIFTETKPHKTIGFKKWICCGWQ